MSKSPSVEVTGGRVKQSLAALKASQESLGKFAIDLFADFDGLRQQVIEVRTKLHREQELLEQERRNFAEQQAQRTDEQSGLHQKLQAKMAEMEKDRLALDEELATLRANASHMADTIAQQKQEMAEEHAEWAAELRQLRHILDKQATWIEQQAESPVAGNAETGKASKQQNVAAAAQSSAGNAARIGSNRSRIIPAGGSGNGSEVALSKVSNA